MIMLVKTVIGNNQYIVRFVGLKNGNIDKMYAIKKNQISRPANANNAKAVKTIPVHKTGIKQLLDDVNYVDNL